MLDDEMPYDDMTDTQFEEFCFALMQELGFVNVDWRKGTGLSASPADRGRDIVADLPISEVDGSQYMERWFVDCKHYKQGVPPEKVAGLLSWAAAERPHVALVIASNYLSNPCKDNLKLYETNNRPPFRVKYWERPHLKKMLEGREAFVSRYVKARPRTEAEIIAAEERRTDKLWYYRKELLFHLVETGQRQPLEPGTESLVKESMRKIMETYAADEDFVIAGDDQEGWNLAYLMGELSALRWVLGDDWNNADS